MKLQNIAILCGLWVIISCQTPIDKPSDLINKNDFIDIMTDFYLYKGIDRSMAHTSTIDYAEMDAFILQKHEVSWPQFKDSYGYYMLSKGSSEEIYEAVKERLQEIAPEIPNPTTVEPSKNIPTKPANNEKLNPIHLDNVREQRQPLPQSEIKPKE